LRAGIVRFVVVPYCFGFFGFDFFFFFIAAAAAFLPAAVYGYVFPSTFGIKISIITRYIIPLKRQKETPRAGRAFAGFKLRGYREENPLEVQTWTSKPL
jgi:hypothetical protein